MHMILMVVDGMALMLGSLLAAMVLTWLAWLAAARLHRPWLSLMVQAGALAGMLASPMEHSLFVRMTTVFCAVGAVLLYFAVLEARAPSRMPPSHKAPGIRN